MKSNKTRNTKLYLVAPSEHGNGGWCGSSTLAYVTPKWMLARDPVVLYCDGHYAPMFGSQLRLCKTEDPNDAVYLWDHHDNMWLDANGKAIRKTEIAKL